MPWTMSKIPPMPINSSNDSAYEDSNNVHLWIRDHHSHRSGPDRTSSLLKMKTFDFYLEAVQYCRTFKLDLALIKRLNWKKWYIDIDSNDVVDINDESGPDLHGSPNGVSMK